MDDAAKMYADAVKQRSAEVKQALANLIGKYVGCSEDERKTLVERLRHSCKVVMNTLIPTQYPRWLPEVHNHCEKFLRNPSDPGHANRLAQAMTACYSQVDVIDLSTANEPNPYDLDALYEQAKAENKIPELFDRLIESIQRIIDDRIIENVTILEAIKSTLDVLKANRSGSLVSMRQSFGLVRVFLSEFAIRLIKTVPVAKQAVEAIEAAVSSMDKGFDDVAQTIDELTKVEIARRFPSLEDPSQIVMGYVVRTKGLPEPNSDQSD